ncbi:MAG: hypothetical protein WD512_05575 [Candidatus Paceibacterota bacterium]
MIIGISGKLNSGKDTIAQMIQYLDDFKRYKYTHLISLTDFKSWEASEHPQHSKWKIKKFAGKLKDIVCLLIGCTREQLEDREFKEKPLGEKWKLYRAWKGGIDTGDYEEVILPLDTDILLKYEDIQEEILTPRKLMQLLGTKCGREILHPNIWSNALFADYNKKWIDSKSGFAKKELPKWIISDVRFPNEAQVIKDRNGILIRINRTTNNSLINNDIHAVTNWQHPSETSLDSYDNWDYVVENDGSLEDLLNKVRKIYEKI